MTRELAAAVNGSFVRAFVRAADLASDGASRTFGPVTAVHSGTAVKLFNRVFALEPVDRTDLADAVSWLDRHGDPFQLVVSGQALDRVAPVATDLGLEPTGNTQPGMALASLDAIPEPDPALDVDLEVVEDSTTLAAYLDVQAAVFGIPDGVIGELVTTDALDAPDQTMLVGRVDGEPVATGLVLVSDGVAGVYSVAVTEPFRRRGLGTAMTRALLRHGREAGAAVGTLQSSEMGYPVYEQMGFETVVTYHMFAPGSERTRPEDV